VENKDPCEIKYHEGLQYDIIVKFNLFCEIKNVQSFVALVVKRTLTSLNLNTCLHEALDRGTEI
jgi:hypothetical protein